VVRDNEPITKREAPTSVVKKIDVKIRLPWRTAWSSPTSPKEIAEGEGTGLLSGSQASTSAAPTTPSSRRRIVMAKREEKRKKLRAFPGPDGIDVIGLGIPG